MTLPSRVRRRTGGSRTVADSIRRPSPPDFEQFALSLGGILLSITTLVPAFRRLRRHFSFPSLKRRGGCAEQREGAAGVVNSATMFRRTDHPGASRHPSFSRRGK